MNNWQQQQQQPWLQPPWGYPGWDAAAGTPGWGWPGYEQQQQYGWPPMPPLPPPAPPLPSCFVHPAGQQQQHQGKNVKTVSGAAVAGPLSPCVACRCIALCCEATVT
jgi:hypothetical protein